MILLLRAAASEVGVTTYEKFIVFNFKGENRRSRLNWLYMAMTFVEAIVFGSKDFLQVENLRSMIGRWWCLYTISFLKALVLEKLNFWCCLGGVSVVTTRI
jgi:hypothetical protein